MVPVLPPYAVNDNVQRFLALTSHRRSEINASTRRCPKASTFRLDYQCQTFLQAAPARFKKALPEPIFLLAIRRKPGPRLGSC